MGEDYKVNEIEQQEIQGHPKQVTRHRELLSAVINAAPKLQYISSCDESGDMSFAVNIKEVGLSNDDFYKYHREIFSNFVVDFIGELLIRENLQLFAPHITSMKSDTYLDAVSHCNHKRFGMKIEKGCMVFKFHISLLQEILTEDFKIS